MTDWYLMKPQPTLNSGFEKDEFADYARDGFDELLTETQLGKEVILCNGKFDGEHFETEFTTTAIVQSETPDTYTQGWKRQLLTRVADSISNYKYIKYDNQIWLIMNEPSDNCIYDKCVLHQCNYVLKWQLSNRDIVYYPSCIENASQYNAGEEGNKTLVLGYNQIMVYLSMDDISVLINREQRMFVDYNTVCPVPYRVTRHDTVCYSYGRSRVLCLVMTEDQYNPDTDSIEEWLCDYVTSPASTAILYSGNSTIRLDSTKTLRIETDKPVVWSIESDIGATIISNGSSAKIKCPKGEYLGNIIEVKADIEGIISKCELAVVGGV